MRLLSWWRRSRTPINTNPEMEKEQRDRKADLAHAVVRFERRRYRVHQIAEEAMHRMQEGR